MTTQINPLMKQSLTEVVNLIEDDLRSRMMTQTTVTGGSMPKKKYPQRSLDPEHFCINTGQSWPLIHRYISESLATITVTRPEILTLPNPGKGFFGWFGVPERILQQATQIVKKWM